MPESRIWGSGPWHHTRVTGYRYVPYAHLASGGMGDLHLARATGATGIDRMVVTKRLRPELLDDERATLMLVDEARTAARLYHRNLVQVLDIVLEGDVVMLVLEYFPSVNLAQLLDARNGRLPDEDAAEIVGQVADALHYAHERCDDRGDPLEIIHRDVSLPNVLIGEHGHIKLTDFGVAKSRSRLYVTRSSTMKGKLGYMAPEQITGSSVDRRVDVFALGVVLFEVTTGVPMFTAASDYETLRRVTEGEIPEPGELRADYPADLERIVRRAVALDRQHRYATTAEMARELRALGEVLGWRSSPSQLGRLVAAHAPGPRDSADAPAQLTTRRWRSG